MLGTAAGGYWSCSVLGVVRYLPEWKRKLNLGLFGYISYICLM